MTLQTIFLRIDGRRWLSIKEYYYKHICNDQYKRDNRNVKKATLMREFIEYAIDKFTKK